MVPDQFLIINSLKNIPAKDSESKLIINRSNLKPAGPQQIPQQVILMWRPVTTFNSRDFFSYCVQETEELKGIPAILLIHYITRALWDGYFGVNNSRNMGKTDMDGNVPERQQQRKTGTVCL